MDSVLGAALEVQKILKGHGERFCIIGGLAVQRWGKQRLTQDVDVTLLCPFGSEPAVIERLLSLFQPRLPDAREFARRNRVLLLRTAGGVELDLSLGAIPFEERCVARSSEWEISPGSVLRTCSAEDLIVLKAFAGRTLDWFDVESVAIRNHGKLDWKLVFEELRPLVELKGTPEALERLRELQRDPRRRK